MYKQVEATPQLQRASMPSQASKSRHAQEPRRAACQQSKRCAAGNTESKQLVPRARQASLKARQGARARAAQAVHPGGQP